MAVDDSKTKLSIARLTFWQAILVALITTSGGILAGIQIGGIDQKQISPKQRWLTIHNVRASLFSHVRIIASVNNVKYVYPTNVIWAGIGSGMSSERFPIPVSKNNGVRSPHLT